MSLFLVLTVSYVVSLLHVLTVFKYVSALSTYCYICCVCSMYLPYSHVSLLYALAILTCVSALSTYCFICCVSGLCTYCIQMCLCSKFLLYSNVSLLVVLIAFTCVSLLVLTVSTFVSALSTYCIHMLCPCS